MTSIGCDHEWERRLCEDGTGRFPHCAKCFTDGSPMPGCAPGFLASHRQFQKEIRLLEKTQRDLTRQLRKVSEQVAYSSRKGRDRS